jgi:nucleotide-binding universal stress UspA family protein
MYRSIVVGTDGSETAQRAVEEASRLAVELGGELHIVSAFEPLRGTRIVVAPEGAAKVWAVPPDARVRSIVEEAVAGVRFHGVDAKSHTLTGDAADALIEIAELENADLIVVGSHGMHGVKRMLGSVPNKVSHHARCSVLIVCTDEPSRLAGRAAGDVVTARARRSDAPGPPEPGAPGPA